MDRAVGYKMSLAEQFKEELAMLKKAPLTFVVGFIVLAVLIGWTEYSFGFKEILTFKNSQIETLKEQLRSTKGTNGNPSSGSSSGGSSSGTATGNCDGVNAGS